MPKTSIWTKFDVETPYEIKLGATTHHKTLQQLSSAVRTWAYANTVDDEPLCVHVFAATNRSHWDYVYRDEMKARGVDAVLEINRLSMCREQGCQRAEDWNEHGIINSRIKPKELF